jgi:regulatory protein
MTKGLSKEKALAKAQSLCAKMEKSRGDIRKKLYEWRVEKQFHEEILEILEKEKFIDEGRYVRLFVRDKLKLNKWGKIKIDYALKAREISSKIIQEALEEIDMDEYAEICFDLLKKKLKTLSEDEPEMQKEKLARFGQGRGYESALLKRIIGELLGAYK